MSRTTVAELAERVQILEELWDENEEGKTDTGGLEDRILALENASPNGLESRVLALETMLARLGSVLAGEEPKKAKRTRKKRTYTDEERAAVRDRLVAGKKAAAERREAAKKAKAEVAAD